MASCWPTGNGEHTRCGAFEARARITERETNPVHWFTAPAIVASMAKTRTLISLHLFALTACLAPVDEPWAPDLSKPLTVVPCRPVLRVVSQSLDFEAASAFTARPGQYALFTHSAEPKLRLFSPDPDVDSTVIKTFDDWPPSSSNFAFRPATTGYVMLTKTSRDEESLSAVHFGAHGISSTRSLSTVPHIGQADITVAGEWLLLSSQSRSRDLLNETASVTRSAGDNPLHTFDGGIKAFELTAPDTSSLIDGRGPRVLIGARELDLPTCEQSRSAYSPRVYPFRGGHIVVQRCATALAVSRYSTETVAEVTVTAEFPAPEEELQSFDAAVDDGGRLAIVWALRKAPPLLSFLRVDDLTTARASVVLSSVGCYSADRIRIEAAPAQPGRFGVFASRGWGHGTGCSNLTRLEVCEQ